MKFFCIILSIYVVIIALMPCNDSDDCNSALLSVQTSQNNSEQQHEEQSCSPFCSCSCCNCAGFFISLPFTFNGTFYYNTEKKIPLYTSLFSKDFTTVIWQPPKLS